ncbi:MAG: hypothetical protein ACTSRK_18645 [Promethearchaeota archaeon]
MSADEILAQIEQFETAFEFFHQKIDSHMKEFTENLSVIWKTVKILKEENSELLETIKDQDVKLMALRTESESLDQKTKGLKTDKENLTTMCSEFSVELQQQTINQKEIEFQITSLDTKITVLNERILARESEKAKLDQNKIQDTQLNRKSEVRSEQNTRYSIERTKENRIRAKISRD